MESHLLFTWLLHFACARPKRRCIKRIMKQKRYKNTKDKLRDNDWCQDRSSFATGKIMVDPLVPRRSQNTLRKIRTVKCRQSENQIALRQDEASLQILAGAHAASANRESTDHHRTVPLLSARESTRALSEVLVQCPDHRTASLNSCFERLALSHTHRGTLFTSSSLFSSSS